MRSAVIILMSFLIGTTAVHAQTVLVEVTAAESGAPLSGAFVSLVDAGGSVLRSALTDSNGRVLLTSTAPGFRVRAEHIGRASQLSDGLSLRSGESQRISLALPLDAIRLAEIRVEPGSRCRLRPAEALEIADVWDAARKALSIQAWSERTSFYQLQVSTYERDLDSQGRRVERESRRGATRATRTPFAALPVQQLLEGGFIQPDEGGGHQYFAPDATLLLSDEFLGSHCFRLVRSSAERGALGLAFEPVRRDVPDIQGTLWLDEESAQLRHLDFSYTWTPYEEASGVAGGRVEFAAMPDGGWIIDRWWIRAPIVARHTNLTRTGDTGIRVSGVRETGGEVLGATPRSTLANARGSIGGLVWDSTRVRPLEGAAVTLSGTEHTATTDRSGRFVLGGIPAGIYDAVFTHPHLDTLGIRAPAAEVEVTAGKAVQLELAVPSTASIMLAMCRQADPSAEGGVFTGTVTDRVRGGPVPGATVRLEWQMLPSTQPVVVKNEWFEVRTDEEGRYTACGVPTGPSVRVRAALLTYQSDTARLSLQRPDHRVVNLALELPNNVGAPIMPRRESGLQGVQGVLMERESTTRVSNAEVTIRTVGGEVIASGLTNAEGMFRFTMPTPGRYLLSANALGYRQLAGEAIQVERGQLAVLEIRMAPAALALAPVVVAAEARSFHLDVEGFYSRQLTGAGRFLAEDALQHRRTGKVSEVLRSVPGTYVVESNLGNGGRAVYFRSGIRASSYSGATLTPDQVCWPMVFVNRQLVSTGGSPGNGAEPTVLDDIVHPSDVLAMEVYRSPAEVPPEFSGPNSGCGVIVVWTGRGGG